ncbi:MAG TPA: protein kinase [Anaerolineales bacterium]|nr:protein kinase [Anaerolineales bacterium]
MTMQPEKIGIYEVKSELGRGGMATVYRAYDSRFEREVAVKVLPQELLHADPQFRLRFEREAKIIAQLEHSAIVPVYDVGESEGQPYFVMRYMNGGSLSDRIKAGIFTMDEAIQILGAISPALDEAHAKGIVHRDIKPSNILFDKRGNPYISDFGIAKLSQAQSGNVTGSAIIGTPAYMAPEQAQGVEVDGRADIYALGIILFEMLTGKQPYEADTPMAVAIKHITDPVPQIRQSNPKLPEGMEAIIQKAMAKNRENRFSSAVEMTNALREVARNITTRLQGVPAAASSVAPAAPTVKADAAVLPSKRSFNALFIIVPIVVMAALAGGFFLFNTTRAPAETQAPVSTSTSAPQITETSTSTNESAAIPVVMESTSTETAIPPTETATQTPSPSIPVRGGADKIAFVANSDIWIANVDGSELTQLTNDGGAKNDLQWLPDSGLLIYISGLTVKSYNVETGVVDNVVNFPSASSFNAFRVSHDGKQVMIAVNNEIFVVPFDLETMKGVSKKSDLLALDHCIIPEGQTKSALIVKEARWAIDDALVAWLFKGPTGTDLVSVLDIQDCTPATINILDTFPGTRFEAPGFQGGIMLDFDWDGSSNFIFHTARRNNGWGELHIYNWETHRPTLTVNPIEKRCCYRDARWSPDGSYLLFAFQDEGLADAAQTVLYYVPFGDIVAGANLTPISLPDGFFKNPREAPQPALRPAQ